jgi:carboxylate-amine ligase
MTLPHRLHLFQAFGVELEYMIVDRDTLAVRPLADELLKAELGAYGSDFENGIVTWSNELVMHVIELKSTRPESDFVGLRDAFVDNIHRVNGVLSRWNAMLMPTAAHPLMDPLTETRLWPHDNNEVYDAYNRIFDCRGHGWSNLQSTHLNLPFYDDEEFAKLHAAIRVVLPLLPALCASSPILEGKATGLLNTRLQYYASNQQVIPSITGSVIPEAVFSRRQYFNTIYEKIRQDIAPYNTNDILDPVWVNSRGAIPRFDRGSVEIRIMDIQECPQADLAIQTLVIETIRALTQEKFAPLEELMHQPTDRLAALLHESARIGPDALVDDGRYLALFGATESRRVGDLWHEIYRRLGGTENPLLQPWAQELQTLLNQGPLAKRMLSHLAAEPGPENLKRLYRSLGACLQENRMLPTA